MRTHAQHPVLSWALFPLLELAIDWMGERGSEALLITQYVFSFFLFFSWRSCKLDSCGGRAFSCVALRWQVLVTAHDFYMFWMHDIHRAANQPSRRSCATAYGDLNIPPSYVPDG